MRGSGEGVWEAGRASGKAKGRGLCTRPCPKPRPRLVSLFPNKTKLDDGVQNTGTRKFLTVLPVATFLLASHGTAWERQVRPRAVQGV